MSLVTRAITILCISIQIVGWAQTYSTGFFLFSTSASSAQSNCSTCGVGVESTTPLSISCGPKCDSLEGRTSLKRERNMTMNCAKSQYVNWERDERASSAPFRVSSLQQCLGYLLTLPHAVVTEVSLAWEARSRAVERRVWWPSWTSRR